MFLSDWDLGRLAGGKHATSYQSLGAHPAKRKGRLGTRFAVWAPNAEFVSVIGDFNRWNRDQHPMLLRGDSGVWEAFVPGLGDGDLYKYFVRSKWNSHQAKKADPYAFAAEVAPRTASRVCHLDSYAW